MGLEAETFERGKDRRPVAAYVDLFDDEHGTNWREWLQTHRYELNAMTSPQFLAWLDGKMDEHGVGKVIPPQDVIDAEVAAGLESMVREAEVERILREAGIDDLVAARLRAIGPVAASPDECGKWLDEQPEREWRGYARDRAMAAFRRPRR